MGSLIIVFYIIYTILDTANLRIGMLPSAPSAMTPKYVVSSSNALLSVDPKELLNRQDNHKLRLLLGELDAIGEYKLLGKMVNKLGENFEAVSKKARLQSAKMFKKLTPVLWSTGSENMHAGFSKTFMTAADKEADERVYVELADLLKEMVDWSFETGKNITLTKDVIEMLRRHQKVPSEFFPKRCELAFKALRKIADKDAILKLIEMLKSQEWDIRRSGYEITMAISGGWLKRMPKRMLLKRLSGVEYSMAEKIVTELQKK